MFEQPLPDLNALRDQENPPKMKPLEGRLAQEVKEWARGSSDDELEQAFKELDSQFRGKVPDVPDVSEEWTLERAQYRAAASELQRRNPTPGPDLDELRKKIKEMKENKPELDNPSS